TNLDGLYFNGYMDEFRITKGQALWTADFTPPNNPDSPPATDTDSDGISDDNETTIYGTDPGLTDTDSDGIDDGDELNFWGDPGYLTDHDGDIATYPNNLLDPDSDNDGLLDGEEVNTYGTSPALTDTDSDGIDDNDEIDTYLTDPNVVDTDADGLDDGTELDYWNASAYNWYDDDDADGLENIVDPDSDNDGFNDGAELIANTNPADPLNFPAVAPEGIYIQSNTTNGSTVFTDESGVGHVVTVNGNVHHEAFGLDTAIAYDGTGDYLSLADHDDWDFGAGEFTIDLWVNYTAVPSDDSNGIFGTGTWPIVSSHRYAMKISNGTFQWYNPFTDWADTGVVPVADTWYHLAVVRSSDTLSIYVNGSETITADCTGLLINSSDTGVAIGRVTTNLDSHYFNGYMDEFRITKGQALWTADFTPPNSPAP
ncbi:MAG: hypothetical protein PF482_08000, partial [Desulfobacteraceae bacterium]|nr:hypothetical protein [Desulfobacteraceae bacterium]